jgi:hypothetical protein
VHHHAPSPSRSLFGFAVSGVFVMQARPSAASASTPPAALYRAFSVIPVSFSYLYVGLEPRLRELGLPGFLATACEYALLAVPFFASGVCISLLLFHGAREANRLYAVDLVSSALGAVAVIPALTLGVGAVLAASAAAALGASSARRVPRGAGPAIARRARAARRCPPGFEGCISASRR